jgi:hypothetical protein
MLTLGIPQVSHPPEKVNFWGPGELVARLGEAKKKLKTIFKSPEFLDINCPALSMDAGFCSQFLG